MGSFFDTTRIPTTSDGRQIFLPSTIGDDEDVQFTGRGDDVDNGDRFEGTKFWTTVTASGEVSIEWQFIEWVDLNGGGIHYHGANIGDYVHYEVYSVTTSGTNNPGAGDYNKYNLGGPYNMFIPAVPGTGDWDLDLESTLNENVSITTVVPVPADGAGYFDWDEDTGAVTVNTDGTGNYHLFDFPITLTRIINHFPLMGDCQDSFIVPASYGAKKLLPHYKHRITIYHGDESNLDVCWWLFLGRNSTQP